MIALSEKNRILIYFLDVCTILRILVVLISLGVFFLRLHVDRYLYPYLQSLFRSSTFENVCEMATILRPQCGLIITSGCVFSRISNFSPEWVLCWIQCQSCYHFCVKEATRPHVKCIYLIQDWRSSKTPKLLGMNSREEHVSIQTPPLLALEMGRWYNLIIVSADVPWSYHQANGTRHRKDYNACFFDSFNWYRLILCHPK